MKINNPWIDSRVQQVRPTAAQSYLLSRGWKPMPYPLPEILPFEGPPDDFGEPIVQLVPLLDDAPDYLQRVIELITALAIIEDRSAVEVLNDILGQAASDRPLSKDGLGPAAKAGRARSNPEGKGKRRGRAG